MAARHGAPQLLTDACMVCLKVNREAIRQRAADRCARLLPDRCAAGADSTLEAG